MLDQPGSVVESAELLKGVNQFRYGTEVANPEQLFLERFEKTFDAAVALGFTDEGGRGLDPEEPDFVLKVIAHELRPVIVAKLESCRAMGVKAAEVLVNGCFRN